jgi:hypothetical protein
MNNNLYNWHDEQMVRHEMREVDQAVAQARLLKAAGLSGDSWLARAVNTLRNFLKARRKGFQDHHSIEPQAYQSDKLAP